MASTYLRVLCVLTLPMTVFSTADSGYACTMIPKDSMNRNRLCDAHKIPTSSIEHKYSSDAWTLQQIPPGNGSLHSPLMGPDGFLYAYRLNVDYKWLYQDGVTYDNISTYTLQVFKLTSSSFNPIWYSTLIENASFFIVDQAYSTIANFQDLTYYSSASSSASNNNISSADQHVGFIIADVSKQLVILNASDGDIVSRIPFSDEMIWWIDDDCIRVIRETLSYSPYNNTFSLAVYSILNGSLIRSDVLESLSSSYDVDIDRWSFHTETTANATIRRIFQISANDSITCFLETDNGLQVLWQNTDFHAIDVVVNDVLRRIYALGYKEAAESQDTVFLYSIDFDGNLMNRQIISNEFGLCALYQCLFDFAYDVDDRRYVFETERRFALSFDGRHLYLYVVDDFNAYFVHFALDENDNISSEKTKSIKDDIGDYLFLSSLRQQQLVIDAQDNLFLSVMISRDQYEKMANLAYDGQLNKLWSKHTENHVFPNTNFAQYKHRSYSSFDAYHQWYVTDRFYANSEDVLGSEWTNAGYFKIDVYGEESNTNAIYEWKFWSSIAVTVLSVIMFVLLRIFAKNRTLKVDIETMHAGSAATGNKSAGRDTIRSRVQKIQTLISCVGLVLLSTFITIIHFEKIGTISHFLDTVGSYENVRNVYLENVQIAHTQATNYSYSDLCFCTDSSLKIDESQCDGNYCYRPKYECSAIMQHFGECDLAWFQVECDCTFLVDGCDVTINRDASNAAAAVKPQELYDQCLSSYNTAYGLLWTVYGVHIGFSLIYIFLALLTMGKQPKIGWITRVSSIITLSLLLVLSALLTPETCTGSDKLLGFEYPGCQYVYPEEFEQTFHGLERNTYNDVVAVLLVYGMKTALKVVQVWIPFSCTAHDFCLRD